MLVTILALCLVTSTWLCTWATLSIMRGLTSTSLTALMLDGGYAQWLPFTMPAHHGLSGTRRLPPTAPIPAQH
eukprot:5978340-Amphidinium_carterae.1